jgi:hypothetical protein
MLSIISIPVVIAATAAITGVSAAPSIPIGKQTVKHSMTIFISNKFLLKPESHRRSVQNVPSTSTSTSDYEYKLVLTQIGEGGEETSTNEMFISFPAGRDVVDESENNVKRNSNVQCVVM